MVQHFFAPDRFFRGLCGSDPDRVREPLKKILDEKGNETFISETFEAEDTNPIEMQKQGWQSILNNFKKLA